MTILISTSLGCFEAQVTSVHQEPCTQLVLNSGSYHAQSLYTDPTEGGSVCTGKLQGSPAQALHSGWVTLSKPPRLFWLRPLIYRVGRIVSALCMKSSRTPPTVVLTDDIIPPGGQSALKLRIPG